MAIYEVYEESCKDSSSGKIELREEQKKAVGDAKTVFERHFTDKKPFHKFLWNAKMRFGKTLCAMQLAKEMGVKCTLIVTHRPVVNKSWAEDFEKIFEKSPSYKYGTKFEKDEFGNFDDLERFVETDGNHYVFFVSMQYLRLSKLIKEDGDNTELKKKILDNEWDLVVVDEAHEGTMTYLGSRVVEKLSKPNTCVLHLSGTPFNLYDDFSPDEIFTWDYIQEQKAKREWPKKYPMLPNPYAELPKMRIFTYDLGKLVRDEGLIKEGAGFMFTEFFRTWRGNTKLDGKTVEKENVGKFVHEESVNAFLDLMCKKDDTSNYPFSTDEYRKNFKHTLWIVPGVNAAKALETLLKEHRIFKNFKVVNVAGNSDDDYEDENALEKVRNAIGDVPEHTRTITISCGRLTTGATVKPWTAVFYMKGSENTNVATYMQTIFRVQTPYHTEINGKKMMKSECYVFDFAPDRSLKMMADAARFFSKTSKDKLKSSSVANEKELDSMRTLLEFCPVISYEGGEMREFTDNELYAKLSESKIDRVVTRGFDDNALYNIDELLKMDANAVNDLLGLLGKTPGMKKAEPFNMAEGGLGGTKPKPDKGGDTKGEDEEDEETKEKKDFEKAARKERDNRIAILRGVSLRIPLLMFGAEVKDENKDVTVDNFAEHIDEASWAEFMPRGFTKEEFAKIKVCYDPVVFNDSWKRYRQLAREADFLSIEERIKAIATIFGYFHNPDKETVLTPWRVVNMHMSDTIGGYSFFNEKFDGPNLKENAAGEIVETLEPRWVEQKDVTENIFKQADKNGDTSVKILEINSKTGLYPLYVTYSLYRSILPIWKDIYGEKGVLSLKDEQALWDKILQENIFVICNTPMAARITKRTLVGFRDVSDDNVNIKAIKLIEEATTNRDGLVKDLKRPGFWHKGAEGEEMKFNAVVGNPPYQVMTAKTDLEKNGQARRKSIFQLFQMVADALNPRFVSMIYPGGRWIHRSGKGMEQFGLEQINDIKLSKVIFYPNSEEIFESVDIADGISIVFKDGEKKSSEFEYVYKNECESLVVTISSPGEKLIPLNPKDDSIVCKVEEFVAHNKLEYVSRRILSQKLFGIESEFVELNPKKVKPFVKGYKLDENEIKLFTNDKAGKAGRSQWYVAKRSVIEKDKQQYIDMWKVVVSSANAGGQKRDSQLAIIDNHSAFGRSRVALGSFKTKVEAENFYKFCRTALVRFMFLMTDEALTSLGKKVPDLKDYTNKNSLVDFSGDLDDQLNNLVGLTKSEVEYINGAVRPLVD